MKSKIDLNKLTEYLYEVSTLRKLPRMHRQTLLNEDATDTIAAHELLVSKIGYFLAKIEKADLCKVLLMCLIHDDPETRSGDQNWVHKRYLKVFENEILLSQMKDLPFGKDLLSIAKEYQKKQSLEAMIAKDADLLAQVILLKEYQWSGSKEASRWLKGKEQGKRLKTPAAKALVKEIVKQRPSQWWENVWTADRR